MENSTLLHNMSAPPKTVVRYSGLSELANSSGPGGTGISGVKFNSVGLFGTPVRFVLPFTLRGQPIDDILSAKKLLRYLEIDAQPDAEEHLVALINDRANALPLPDGCVVIPAIKNHYVRWADALTALAVLTKCSDTIWLRAKTPALSAAVPRRQVSLLVPPQFSSRLPEPCVCV
jgi:hypothetical protein